MLAKVALAALIAAATFLAPASDCRAQEWVAPGPKEGASFPDVLNAPDQTGRHRTLEDLMGRTGLVIAFVRSADWCPFCMKQLVDLQSHTAQFEELGMNVAAVSVDSVELVRKFADAQRITFVMLADPTGAINERLGIRDAQYPVGSSAYGVPQPGIFVLNRDRKIIGKHFVQGYRDRPDLDAILTGLRAKLEGAGSAGQRE